MADSSSQADAQLLVAQARLSEVELKDPFAGVLVSCPLKAGELVSPGTSVVVQIDALPDLELPGKVVRINEPGENRLGDIVDTVLVGLDEQDARLRWNLTSAVKFGE